MVQVATQGAQNTVAVKFSISPAPNSPSCFSASLEPSQIERFLQLSADGNQVLSCLKRDISKQENVELG